MRSMRPGFQRSQFVAPSGASGKSSEILRWAQNDKYQLEGDTAGSENVKSSHQFLARFHRLRWIHPTEHFFPTLTIHCCEFTHEPVARFPFCVFARANAEREQQGHDPNRNVCRGDKKHKKRTSRLGNPNEIVFVFGTSSSKSP